ncbi:MAG TPA: hypothetical protein VMW73_15080 [Spirochaetia bacterium]|nr:hypothetical protein [Spirochaetia bacterium]
MAGLHPHIYTRGEDRLEVRSSRIPRALFGLFALFVFAGMAEGGSYPVALLVILAIAVLAAIYTDRWVFNRTTGTAEYHFGLPYLHTRRIVRFEDIAHIEYETAMRGTLMKHRREGSPAEKWKAQTVYTTLRMVMRDGKSYSIGIVTTEVVGASVGAAQRFAEFCNRPLSPSSPETKS